ncbi:MAG: hypothetical protein ACYCO3_13665, partial [Mycobacteriales bacterium]
MRSLARRRLGTAERRSIIMPRRLPDSLSWHVSGPAVTQRARRLRRSISGRVAAGVGASGGRSWGASGAAGERRSRGAGGAAGGRGSGGASGVGQSARARLLARRRRALIVLASAVVFSALLALVGALPGLLQLLCDLALVAYLWHLRTQARRRVSERAVRTRQASREAPPVHSRRPAARIPVEVAEVSAELAPAVGYGAAWDPVPVPPPSYVNQAQLGSPEAP